MILNDDQARETLYTIMDLYPDISVNMPYDTPYHLMIALILSAQTSDKALAKITPSLFKRYPNPQVLASSSPAEIESYIDSIGLYHRKAQYIYQASCQIIERFHGEVPSNRQDLMKIAGIGRKSANLILSKAYNIPAFAVDGHITRIAKHHGLVAAQASPRKIEDRVTRILPPQDWGRAHQAMIEFGRHICRPYSPTCHLYLTTLPSHKMKEE